MNDTAPHRKLAALMSADVVGYSRLMRDDEVATIAALRACRDVFRGRSDAHGGRLVDATGDAILAEFPSVVDAVRCAADLQEDLAARNAELPEERRMRFRIGVHLGDVVVQPDGTIFGDGINVAARLQALAAPGGVAVSASVFEQVRKRVSYDFDDRGTHEVKNIDAPVHVFHMHTEASDPSSSAADTAVSTRPPARVSIAVLPFDNMGGGDDQDYFADGITEDIITELARFQELAVAARNSVFTYKNRPVKVQTVARELGVRYVLEGSVRRSGERVRITAQLVDGTNGHHLWAERFDRDLKDVFAVQDEVTARIVASLPQQLETSERRRVRGEDRPENLQAYDLVLQGREFWFRFTPEDNQKARELYQQAIELDPSYARAYASLAWTYLIEYDNQWTSDPRATLAQARTLAQRGVEINPASHTNHLTLGLVHQWSGHLQDAIRAFERGLRLNPNDVDAYGFLAYAHCFNGASDTAIDLMEEASRRNPNLSPWARGVVVVAHVIAERYQAAVDAMERMDSSPELYLRWYAAALGALGRDEDARRAMDRYRARYPKQTVANLMATAPFSDAAVRDRIAGLLRAAGLD